MCLTKKKLPIFHWLFALLRSYSPQKTYYMSFAMPKKPKENMNHT